MIDPDLLGLPSLRAALAHRDIGRVYQILAQEGIPQRTLAEMVGQSQSEVSEIIKGRQVQAYDVLVRICTGLGVPREWMGLAYHGGTGPVPGEEFGEVDEDVKRRALLAVGSVALLGTPVLGELLHIPAPPATPTPLPSRVVSSDVAAIKSLTLELRTVARTYGGGAETLTEVAARSLPLMSVPATDDVRSELASALAELHTLAGWVCVDSGLHDNARTHFATAMSLASDDPRQMAVAFRHAGIQMVDAGAVNDGLKSFQLGLMSAQDPETVAWLHGETAFPLAVMGDRDAALAAIERAREQELSDPFDAADMDYVTARVYERLGRLDTAESFAASAVRKWAVEGHSHRDSVEAQIALASIHVETGERDSAVLAQRAISSVAPLRSVRARSCLARLVDVLETRPEHRALAGHARRVSQAATSI